MHSDGSLRQNESKRTNIFAYLLLDKFSFTFTFVFIPFFFNVIYFFFSIVFLMNIRFSNSRVCFCCCCFFLSKSNHFKCNENFLFQLKFIIFICFDISSFVLQRCQKLVRCRRQQMRRLIRIQHPKVSVQPHHLH